MRGTNLTFIYASIYVIHEVKNYCRGCTHAESSNICHMLGRQKMEGGSVSGETSPDTEKTSMTGLSGKKCPGSQAVGGALADKSSELCHSGCHFLWVSWREQGLTPQLVPNKPKSASNTEVGRNKLCRKYLSISPRNHL